MHSAPFVSPRKDFFTPKPRSLPGCLRNDCSDAELTCWLAYALTNLLHDPLVSCMDFTKITSTLRLRLWLCEGLALDEHVYRH